MVRSTSGNRTEPTCSQDRGHAKATAASHGTGLIQPQVEGISRWWAVTPGGPPNYLRSRDRHVNRGLKSVGSKQARKAPTARQRSGVLVHLTSTWISNPNIRKLGPPRSGASWDVRRFGRSLSSLTARSPDDAVLLLERCARRLYPEHLK